MAPVLKGRRILVVEDEAVLAIMVEDMLIDLGCVVVGVAGTVEKGMAIALATDVALDGAVLDVNIGGEPVFPIAEALTARGVPFVFATGYGTAGLEPRFARRPTVAKPFLLRTLEQALLQISCSEMREQLP